jgi:hypothetical protein
MQTLPRKQPRVRHPFQPEEDALLIQILSETGFVNWESVAEQFTGRTARQCRERWFNYLCPAVRTGPWTAEEDDLLLANLQRFGRAWSLISRSFNGRSENDIKNRWYSHLQHETLRGAGGILVHAASGRKKRQRPAVDPKANALKLLNRFADWPLPDLAEYDDDFSFSW